MNDRTEAGIAKAISNAPFKIECTMQGRQWSGSYYDEARAKDMLSRLRQNGDAENISFSGFSE